MSKATAFDPKSLLLSNPEDFAEGEYRLTLKDPGMWTKDVKVLSLDDIEAVLAAHDKDYTRAYLSDPRSSERPFKTVGVWSRELGLRDWTDHRPRRDALTGEE